MTTIDWHGIFPALTTQFTPAHEIDVPAFERHCDVLIRTGVHGLVSLGSLGENGALTPAEKREILKTTVRVAARRVPVLCGVAETTTQAACAFAVDAEKAGVDGLMVLPPMQYVSDRRETMTHLRAVAAAADVPIMIYNNPVAYRVDITPDMLAELADEPKFVALKESSENVRRVTEILRLTGDRYRVFVGVDNLAMESFLMGAVGWVAGLVGAFPRESVELHRYIMEGQLEKARALYRWFTPLLQLDTDIKFVQYIKLAETRAGFGSEYVRPPRLPLEGNERERIGKIIQDAINSRPPL